MTSSTCALTDCDKPAEIDQQFCASHRAHWGLVAQRLNEPGVALSFHHELDLIDVIMNHDMGLANDPVLRYRHVPESSTWWTSFLVTNRSVEQAFKFIAPIAEPKDVGHRLKSKWADVIERGSYSYGQDLLGSLRNGFRLWQALFQSPWGDLDVLLAHVEEQHNAKEYVLIVPDQEGARVNPLLPLALADIAAMSWGAVWTMSKPGFDFTRLGVRFADTTLGKLRHIISRLFVDNCGVNLNINLVNEKSREHGYLRLWSLLFHTLRQYKRTDWRSVRRTLKSRDGSQRDVEAVTHHGEPRYTYATPHATDALVGFFDGDSGLAGAHVDVAEILANTRDWRLQFFINISESHPLEVVDGALTDTTGGSWHRRVFWRPA